MKKGRSSSKVMEEIEGTWSLKQRRLNLRRRERERGEDRAGMILRWFMHIAF